MHPVSPAQRGRLSPLRGARIASAILAASAQGGRVRIGILLGDDIGPEVVPECVKVLKAAAACTNLDIAWQPLPIGRRGHEEHAK